MIESSFYNKSIKTKIIKSYLNNNKLKDIDSLILGCTHYPLIESEIKRIYKGNVKIINSLKYTSEKLIKTLNEKNILAKNKNGNRKHEFFVSDLTESFQKSAKLFFKEKIILKEQNIF